METCQKHKTILMLNYIKLLKVKTSSVNHHISRSYYDVNYVLVNYVFVVV